MRNKPLQLYVTEEEKEALKKASDLVGLNISSFIRTTILKEIKNYERVSE